MNNRRIVVASLLVTVVGLAAALALYLVSFSADQVSAQSEATEFRLVPGDAAFIGYADVRTVMDSPLRDRARDTLPLRDDGRRQFEAETGISVERDIDRVLAYLTPASPDSPETPPDGLVFARGRFEPSRIESLMRERGAIVETHGDRRVLVMEDPLGTGTGGATGAVALAFIEPGLAAVGTPRLVRNAVDQVNRGSEVPGSEEILIQARSVRNADVWAVGRFDALGGHTRLPDAVAGQLPPISWLSLSLRVRDGLGGVIQAIARDDASAEALREMVRGLLAFGQLQAPSGPAMERLIQSIELRGTGRTVELAFEAPAELLELIPPPSAPQP
jgi:hypothetical protein